ncbi:YchJ family protein [Microbacterium koreense]
MTFGQAAAGSSRGSRPAPDAPCPCGSGTSFAQCCGPMLAGASAPTPERLMRSRYTAFCLRDAAYLRDTWHPGTRPETLELDPGLAWMGLEIIDADADERRGVVEFRARWREGADAGVLHERSRFVHQGDRWWYLDGQVS